jgi:hypothetical protein
MGLSTRIGVGAAYMGVVGGGTGQWYAAWVRCVILRVTLYDRLTLEGTGHRPPRRCRSLWDILGGSLADCRPYTTAGNQSALLLTMVTLSTFALGYRVVYL